MATRKDSSGRQRRLATELRRMRERAGISIQEAAAMLGADRTMVSNIEAARTGVSQDRVRRLACHYSCPDGQLIDALAEMAAGRAARNWWDEYRGKLPDGFLEVSELEHYATRIRTAQTVHLPGLLQTEDHARAIFDLAVPSLPRLEIELRVAHRMDRQRTLFGDNPVPYLGIIHEAALHMRFGGDGITRAQLERLVEAGDQDNIELRVIPFSAGSFHGAGQTIMYTEGTVPTLDAVHLDTSFGGHVLDAPTPLANYRALLDLMEESALSASESQTLIKSIASSI